MSTYSVIVRFFQEGGILMYPIMLVMAAGLAIWGYPEASAGGNMVCRVPVAKPADLAGEVIKGLQGEEGNTCNIA